MLTALPELPPPTDRLCDLTEAEQLVVRAFRRWLAGEAQRETLRRLLAYELGPAMARDVVKGVEAMIRVLTAHACRNIAYHLPCCGALGPDEAGLLTLVTAVQRGQQDLAHIVGSTFVLPDALRVLLAATSLLATALSRARLTLPLRHALSRDIEAPEAPARTIH